MTNAPFPDIHTRDQIAQGRMILLGIAAAYYIVWVLEFITNPILLVPGFALDDSLRTAMALLVLLVRFSLFSVGLLLMWGGLGWMRYVLAIYLLIAGLAAVILSVEQGGFGGAALILGAVELASAAALTLSISVLRYIEDRNRRGIPWVGLSLAFLGLGCIPLAAAGYDVADAALAYHTDSMAHDAAAGMFQKLAPGLDPRVLADSASGRLKENLGMPDFVEQFEELSNELGPMQSLDLPPAPTLTRTILEPVRGPARAFNATAHYAHGDAILSLEVDTSGPEPLFTDVYVERTSTAPADKRNASSR